MQPLTDNPLNALPMNPADPLLMIMLIIAALLLVALIWAAVRRRSESDGEIRQSIARLERRLARIESALDIPGSGEWSFGELGQSTADGRKKKAS